MTSNEFDFKISIEEYYYILRRTQIDSYTLQDPKIQKDLMKRGFRYVKRVNRNYNQIMRSPTIGCFLELSVLCDIDSVPIDSPQGRKLINKLCYF